MTTSHCPKVRPKTAQHPSTAYPLKQPTMAFHDLTFPAATVQKIINEVLASAAASTDSQAMSFAKETRDLLIECCVEFITMISTEANEIAEKDAKKTIACEHVKAALEELDFGDYVPAILEVAQDYKKQQQVRLRRRM